MFAGQVAIIFVGGRAFQIVRISGVQWVICLGLAVICVPWAVVIRCVPDAWAERVWLVALRPVVQGLKKCVEVVVKPFKRMFRKKGSKEEEGEEEHADHLEAVEVDRVASRQ